MNDPEHARTGTSAVGRSIQSAASLRGGGSQTSPPAELVIVDLVTQHNEEPHEQLPGDRDLGFGAPAPMDEGAVGALEVGIQAGRIRGGLPEGEAEERAALLGDVAEVIFVGGGVEGGGQADMADHVLAVVEAGHGAQHDDGGQSRQGPDTWVGDEAGGIGVGQGRRCDRVVELTDLRVESREQLEALIPALRGVRGQREGVQLRQAGLVQELGAPGEDREVELTLENRDYRFQSWTGHEGGATYEPGR